MSWTVEDWLFDVGSERSETSERKPQYSGRSPEWPLVWAKEHTLDGREHMVTFDIEGEPAAVAERWSSNEIEAHRRVVKVQMSTAGSSITASFRGLYDEGTAVSCIWWCETGKCYVTSADVIKLLEPLLCPGRSDKKKVKARIRRAMASFEPSVVSESRNKELFRLITSFGDPHPWKMRKSFSVLPWRFLEPALRRAPRDYRAVDKSV